MKIRDSGMPDETMWSTFFDPVFILKQLTLPVEGTIVDMGCGYGTFAIPAALMTKGTVLAIDMEDDMLATCRRKAQALDLKNLMLIQRDFLTEGTGLDAGSVDFVMLFNILHTAQPIKLLAEAYRILRVGGQAGIIHWNYDPNTPRGPVMSLRPRPEQCFNWLKQAGLDPQPIIDLPPYHYGIVTIKQLNHNL